MKSWKADGDCCSTWDGVTCDAHYGHVIGLDLSKNWLCGPLKSNSSIFRIDLEALVQNMTYLRELHLDNVNISSSLPESLANLSSLTSLSLSWCILLGEFPSDIFLLPKIQAIDVSGNNNLTGFLPNSRSGSSLKQLRALPNSIGNLKSLSHLDLSGTNFLGELPKSIGNLKSLSHLDLSGANFSGKLPNSIGNLKSLSHLDLSWANFFGELPNSIGNLKSLSHLDLSWANFSGELPNSIGNLKSLSHLDFSRANFLGELPNSIGKLNKFSGEIPPSIGNLSQLTSLSLLESNFHGQLPFTLRNLAKLTSLDLRYSLFSEKLPSSLGNLTQLEELLLSNNNFEGKFPISLTNITKLIRIDISGNYLKGLDGPVPRSISNFTKLRVIYLSSINLKDKMELNIFFQVKELQSLNLSGNNLSVSKENINSTHPTFSYLLLSSCNLREFPDFLKAQNELNSLDLSNNKIEGKIPKWFCNVGKGTLQYLNLSFNLLSGFEQPLKVLPWKSIYYLDLRSNMLQGSLPIPPLKIPRMICNVNYLQVLDISNNRLNGHIPHCLGHFSSFLSVLNMRNNCFQGSMPKTFIKGCMLMTLDFSHNQIQGKIPRSLVQCRMLEVLNLGNNNMNDAFPFWLQSLPELRILILHANRFHGPIWNPHTKLGFSKLHVIDLSHNNFSGRLPLDYFRTWNAMQMVPAKDKAPPEYMGSQFSYYKDSITVVNKGIEIFLVKILTIFTAIDLSNNRFYGEIPISVGNLKGLIVLNLSSNSFRGHFPSSLGNLTALESLDLSQNELLGEIPQQLIGLTFLEYLNLSHNQLVGPIPQGGHFSTFEISSFEGNFGLCGSPLLNKCGNNNETQKEKKEKDEDHFLLFMFLGGGVGGGLVVIDLIL
ncbi:hypothetical protein ACJW31_03G037300 [Castanea mollissima]